MIEHKTWVKDVFDRAYPDYGQKGCSFFNYFGERLVEFARPSLGDKVLDVATGRGAVLFPVSKRVGAQGRAMGIDISSKMIAETSRSVPFSWIELQQMDAEHLLFPDHSFDIVFCAFGLFFFSQIPKALSESKRVLKPNGKFAVSTFSKQTSLDLWIAEKVKGFGITSNFATNVLDRTPALLKQLTDAGFSCLETHEESKVFWHENAEEWWNSLWTHGIRSKLEKLSPSDLDNLKQEALLHAGTGRINEERHAFFVIARHLN